MVSCSRAAAVSITVGLCCAALVRGDAVASAESASPAQAESVLKRALENRYEVDLAQRIALVVRNDRGAQRRYGVEMASKRVAGQLRSFARFTAPQSDNGTAILMIEQHGRFDDTFVYFPYAKRVRRVSSAQRADRFMGTDLIYEDFERRYSDDFEVISMSSGRVENETVLVLRVRPTFECAYRMAEFAIASSDHAILEMRYFKQLDTSRPFRVIEAPRSHMTSLGGHILPKRILVRNLEGRTTTEVRVEQLEVNPALDDSLFTEVSLQVRKRILTGQPSADGADE